MKKMIMKMSFIMSMLALCVGCSTDGHIEQEIPFYSFGIDGNKIAYSPDDKDVLAIEELALGYTKATVTADYRNPSLEEENTYYTKETYETYQSLRRDEIMIERITTAELLQKIEDANLAEIKFYTLKGKKCATVYVDSILTVEHATADWLSAMGDIKLNKQYKRTYILDFVLLEDGTWGITNYDYTDLEEVK